MPALGQRVQYEVLGIHRHTLHTQIHIKGKEIQNNNEITLHLQSLMVAQTMVTAAVLINRCI